MYACMYGYMTYRYKPLSSQLLLKLIVALYVY